MLEASASRLLSHFSPVQLFCDPMDCSLSGSSLHGILQARILEWIATSSSGVSSQPRDQTCISSLHVFCIGRWVLYHLCHLGSGIRELKVMRCFQLKILEEVKVHRIRVLFHWGPVQIPKEVTEDGVVLLILSWPEASLE